MTARRPRHRGRRRNAGPRARRGADPDRRLDLLTGTYAKPGAYGRDGYLLCQKHVTFGTSAGGAGLANEAAGPFQRPAYSMSLPPSRNG